MAILSKIWEFFLGPAAEKGSVDGASKHPLDPLAELEERKVASVKEEVKEAPKPTRTRKTTTTKKPAAPKANAGAKTTKTKGTGKTNGNVRHQRTNSRAGK
jgi:chromatin remodeling complex protein RSC6